MVPVFLSHCLGAGLVIFHQRHEAHSSRVRELLLPLVAGFALASESTLTLVQNPSDQPVEALVGEGGHCLFFPLILFFIFELACA